MTKLKTVPAMLATAPAALQSLTPERDRSRRRDRSEPWRAWYKRPLWYRAIRPTVLRAARFTCAFCGRLFAHSRDLVCDHVLDHRGDWQAFVEGPFQCLCAACHDGPKRRGDRIFGAAIFDATGRRLTRGAVQSLATARQETRHHTPRDTFFP
ncbi:hypothetical protein LNKW23_18100 [Paralimibaculum aggregatum]|uniref:HNH endonuclease n=1 Tax=Paralimibaculum aggregatum TaxID=3036245 RepID=A0ABQ6LLP7_9RHOB|nr:HNH endonuclease [Limibaculum sp. NKW23]GMG82597.1 hypothetical protein LNKW23_18100 [Limibaculum sp. NKW23]